MIRLLGPLLVWLSSLYCFSELTAADPDALPAVDYAREVQPIFARRCAKCHGAEEPEGNFRIDRRKSLLAGGDSGEVAIVPGKSQKSPLLERVAGNNEFIRMPPEGDLLKASEVATLRRWIDAGALIPDSVAGETMLATEHWSFQPLTRPAVPVSTRGWGNNPIDAFIGRKLSENKLRPSHRADRRTLIRRVYLDMLGLLPTPQRVEEFVADDSPQAFELLVEEVLASPHYGERWGRHWLDVVRFAESNGFETNQERPTAYRYRDWVIEAFNNDMSYDQFVKAQLAGDSLGQPAATGFLVGGAFDTVKSPDPGLTAMQRQDELADMVNTTGTAFLGLTIGCARCHSHKFDPILQKDYYSMQAVFAGVKHGERALPVEDDPQRLQRVEQLNARIALLNQQLREVAPGLRPPVNAKLNQEMFPKVKAKFVRFTVSGTNSAEPCLDELEIYSAGESARNVGLASTGSNATSSGNYQGNPKHRLEHIHDGQYGNGRSWISNTAGRGWVQLELSEATVIDRIVWGRDREQQYADRLATKYVIEVSLNGQEWQEVASHRMHLPAGAKSIAELDLPAAGISPAQAAQASEFIDQLRSAEDQLVVLTEPQRAYVGTFTQPGPTYRLLRGDPLTPREQVPPESLTVLTRQVGALNLPTDSPEKQRRLELAGWIAHADNPLTPRVMVNRLWHYHFGRGIVATPSDFGDMGFAPTHSELLDWLASELIGHDWSLKHVHRLILSSATYQQANRPRTEALAIDKGSTLLWRYPPRRLEAEALRDNILLVSGKLDRQLGGPGFMLFHPNSNYSRNWVAKDTFGPPEYRRMVYAMKLRMEGDAVFSAFDCPDGGQIAPRRPRSTTPIQALNLFNSEFLLQQANFFAQRLQSEASDDVPQQIELAFALAYGRSPSAEELADAKSLVNEHSLAALCRAIYNTNEFVFLP